MTPDFYEWPEALAWLVFGTNEMAEVVNGELAYCRNRERDVGIALVVLSERANAA